MFRRKNRNRVVSAIRVRAKTNTSNHSPFESIALPNKEPPLDVFLLIRLTINAISDVPYTKTTVTTQLKICFLIYIYTVEYL